jgi:hypothetical protein
MTPHDDPADWVGTLESEFDWADDEAGPSTVVAEARETGVESLGALRDRLAEAPQSYATGYAKWRYSQELHADG